MKWITSLIMLTFSWTASTRALHDRGFIELRPGHRIYFEHKRAQPGHKTLFLANGLTYTTREWEAKVAQIEEMYPELGIFRFDMEGQGRTLIDKIPNIYGGQIPVEEQVNDLHLLRQKAGVEGPCVLEGLSYGGAVLLLHASLYPEDFEQYIAVAPFLERLEPQDRIIKRNIKIHRFLFPWDQSTDEELYLSYLEQLVRTTYPQAEPIILENVFKIEGIVRMVKGSKDFRAMELVDRLPWRKIHVVGGERDEHVLLKKLNEFVDTLRGGPLASYLIIKRTKHKIPELVPKFSAKWTVELIRNPDKYSDGRTFYGDPLTGEIQSGDDSLLTSKRTFCDRWLRFTPGTR